MVKILRRRIRKEEGNEMKFETTEFHCCPAVSRNYGGKTKEIIIIIYEESNIYVKKNILIASPTKAKGK